AEFDAEIRRRAVQDLTARVVQRERAITRVRQRRLEVGNPTRRYFDDLFVEHRRANGRLARFHRTRGQSGLTWIHNFRGGLQNPAKADVMCLAVRPEPLNRCEICNVEPGTRPCWSFWASIDHNRASSIRGRQMGGKISRRQFLSSTATTAALSVAVKAAETSSGLPTQAALNPAPGNWVRWLGDRAPALSQGVTWGTPWPRGKQRA